ncbi:DUF2325 domain-containing protein [Paraburkholderia bannensis]|uniref:DUF2325 domain-containing protein n=1 Tax=Paraburkholderia bannensis TaxID=765414 RepID=UPI0005AB110A|nr:DUF2325 domain-containing protein [Paraburkholderia bannensis]
MTATDWNGLNLGDEHGTVVRELGRAQRRASAVIAAQAKKVAALEAQAMRLRAAVMIRETALAWAKEELAEVKTSIEGLPKRLALAQQVRALEARVRVLMRGEPKVAAGAQRQATMARDVATPSTARGKVVMWISPDRQQNGASERALAASGVRLVRSNAADAGQLQAGLADADLVICQAGCVSHGDWWRVQDYCSRTGKQCVLVEQPDALDRVIASRARVSVDAEE